MKPTTKEGAVPYSQYVCKSVGQLHLPIRSITVRQSFCRYMSSASQHDFFLTNMLGYLSFLGLKVVELR